MQFSIKHLLAFMVLAALIVLLVQQLNRRAELQRLNAKFAEMNAKDNPRSELAKTNLPYLQAALLEDPTLNESVELAEQALLDIRERLGTLIINDPQAVSVVQLVTIGENEIGLDDFDWRVYVPEEQDVYLKFGIRESARNSFVVETIRPDMKFTEDSAFVPSGPFQQKLLPGIHLIQVSWSRQTESNYHICQIKIDGKLLLNSLHKRHPVDGIHTHAASMIEQKNYPQAKRLPKLIAVTPDLDFDRVEANEGLTPTPYKFIVWLSRDNTEFDTFESAQSMSQEQP